MKQKLGKEHTLSRNLWKFHRYFLVYPVQEIVAVERESSQTEQSTTKITIIQQKKRNSAIAAAIAEIGKLI